MSLPAHGGPKSRLPTPHRGDFLFHGIPMSANDGEAIRYETVDPIIGLQELQMDLWRGVSRCSQNTWALSFPGSRRKEERSAGRKKPASPQARPAPAMASSALIVSPKGRS